MTAVRHSSCVLIHAQGSATWNAITDQFRREGGAGAVGVVVLDEDRCEPAPGRLAMIIDSDEAANVVCSAFDEIIYASRRSIYPEEIERLDWDPSSTPVSDVFAWMEREGRPVFLGQPAVGQRCYLPLCAQVSSHAGVEILLQRLRESYGQDFPI